MCYVAMIKQTWRQYKTQAKHICRILSDCWEHTKDMEVQQFRDMEFAA